MMKNNNYKDTDIKYSFIIPAYNAEKTIVRAVNSIIARINECEIIVVENGSTDETCKTVEESYCYDNRIKLIHSEKGVSRARNEGIRQSTGKWLFFIDADDEWMGSEGDIDSIIDINREFDILCFEYYKNLDHIRHIYNGRDNHSLLKWSISKPTLRMSVWGKAFKRSFIIDNKLLFDETLKVSEDSEFLIRAIKKAKKVNVVEYTIYRYLTDSESAVRSVDPGRTEAYLKALTIIENDLKDTSLLQDQSYRDFVIAHLNLICVHDIYDDSISASAQEKKDMLLEVLENPIIQRAYSDVSLSDTKNVSNVPAFLFKMRMYKLGSLLCKIRVKQNKTKARER